MTRFLASIVLLFAAPALGGCGALIVPVVAGLAVGERVINEDDYDARAEALAAQRAAADGATRVEPSTPEAGTSADVPVQDAERATAMASAPGTRTMPTLEELMDPNFRYEGLGGAPGPDRETYDAFYSRVTSIAQRDPFSEEKRLSAQLVDPEALEPTRAECSFAQTAVLVDLDPAEEAAPLAEDIVADPRLGRVLAGLRAQEVAVLWLSRHTADRAGAVRRALLRSGLDTSGRDELYLVRYEEESKASRRKDAANDFCVVAILGDVRQDFDELFGFLKDPESAVALDSVIGEAWFLAPPPLGATASPETEPQDAQG